MSGSSMGVLQIISVHYICLHHIQVYIQQPGNHAPSSPSGSVELELIQSWHCVLGRSGSNYHLYELEYSCRVSFDLSTHSLSSDGLDYGPQRTRMGDFSVPAVDHSVVVGHSLYGLNLRTNI